MIRCLPCNRALAFSCYTPVNRKRYTETVGIKTGGEEYGI